MSDEAKDWHLLTQNDEYLRVSLERLRQPRLIWVDQVCEIIHETLRFEGPAKIKLKDIGCNVGHFYRGVHDLNLSLHYTGYDISSTYVNLALNYFPNGTFVVEDFSRPLDKSKYSSDVTVISATLEHIENYEAVLENIFETTQSLVVIRTFIGEESLKQICHKTNSKEGYIIYPFSEEDVVSQVKIDQWDIRFIEDRATLGKSKEVCEGITRTMKICVFKKLN